MYSELATQCSPKAMAYFQTIEELDAEVRLAMEAIGANALSTLEDSVSRQQTLCAELQWLKGSLPRLTTSGVEASSDPADALLAQRIYLAGESLAALNLRYAALLQHSSQSMRLFSGLCRGYGTGHEPRGGIGTKQGWSQQP